MRATPADAALADADPTSAPPTRRGRRTRAGLLQAGREVFEELGFDAMRVDDVCRRARVSHGTFYTYFDSKDALFKEVAHAVVGDMFVATRVGADVPDDAYQRIEAANRLYLRAFRRNARLLHVLDHVASSQPEFRELLLDLREDFVGRVELGLVRMQKAEQLPPDLPTRLTAIALGGMVQHLAHVWIDLGESIDEDEAIEVLTVLWARATGLAVPGRSPRDVAARRRTRPRPVNDR